MYHFKLTGFRITLPRGKGKCPQRFSNKGSLTFSVIHSEVLQVSIKFI
jgi:hypothetical protein